VNGPFGDSLETDQSTLPGEARMNHPNVDAAAFDRQREFRPVGEFAFLNRGDSEASSRLIDDPNDQLSPAMA